MKEWRVASNGNIKGGSVGIFPEFLNVTSLKRSESSAWSSSAAAIPAPGQVSFSPNIKKDGTLKDLEWRTKGSAIFIMVDKYMKIFSDAGV